jgi:hypothetical protein
MWLWVQNQPRLAQNLITRSPGFHDPCPGQNPPIPASQFRQTLPTFLLIVGGKCRPVSGLSRITIIIIIVTRNNTDDSWVYLSGTTRFALSHNRYETLQELVLPSKYYKQRENRSEIGFFYASVIIHLNIKSHIYIYIYIYI